jgi:NAD(P)H-hydrate epimerase
VWLGVPREIWQVAAVKNNEAMPFPLPCDEKGRLTADALPELRRRWKNCGVLAMGPGLGRSEEIVAIVSAAVEEFPGVLVLDADALWAVSREEGLLRRARGTVIVTPHMGEFARMGGRTDTDRLSAALEFAQQENCVTVLKGHHTLAAFPDGSASIACAGTAGMAKGGSGDVLTGILAAFAGQLPLRGAVEAALIAHAAAGEACAKRFGEYAMTPSDVIAALPEILREMERR